MSQCTHDLVSDVSFYGNVNMIHNSRIIGVIDIWKCQNCNSLFVEEKRFTDEKPSTDVGLKAVGDGSKWGVLLCLNGDQLSWSLLSIKPGESLPHQCVSPTPSEISVNSEFSVNSTDRDTIHKVLIVEDHMNETVELDDLLNT